MTLNVWLRGARPGSWLLRFRSGSNTMPETHDLPPEARRRLEEYLAWLDYMMCLDDESFSSPRCLSELVYSD